MPFINLRKIILSFVSLSLINFSSAQVLDSAIINNAGRNKKLHFLIKGNLLEKRVENQSAKSFIIPAALISYSFFSLGNHGLQKLDRNTKIEIEEHHPRPITKIDNYLQYSPALAVYLLNTLGIKGKNNLIDGSIIYALSLAISSAFVLPLKRITRIQRPDGSGFNSFPSGHTTTAFAAAEFMRQEYNYASPWYGVAGYTAATITGILRLYNNKHWVSDVVAGVGFGILSTKLFYWLYPAIKGKFFKNKPTNFMVSPF